MIILYSFFGLVSVVLLILFLYSDFFQDALNCTFTDTKLRPDGKPIDMDHKLVVNVNEKVSQALMNF